MKRPLLCRTAGERAAVQRALDANSITAIASDGNANSVVHYLSCDAAWANRAKSEIERAFPNATSTIRSVALVSPIGSNLNLPGVLSDCIAAMSDQNIPLLAISQSIRDVDVKLIVDDADYERAIICVHERLFELSSNASRHIGRRARL